ncbi:hypothetical protein WA026_008480 [Henosepilachna vigintioctopunctata]|uniref:mRNA-decapping enzyme C-terminal domain-containing protein n=1 Tax=Henosepilachna vigintioctopunctata TaxID=420089 RepID=A0AAW1UGX9_9CUCU
MDESVELRMSVASIKRLDPYVKEILATATHVCLYKFNTSIHEWEKTETEGGLFIYSRNGEPFHSIMVMNRLNTNNLIEPIIKDFDYQLQVPFLLYRNSVNKIFGIWFYNKDECIKITYLIELIMENFKETVSDQVKRKDKVVDIFSMLSKAQEDFNKTPTKQDNMPPPFSSTPRLPDFTSKSVQDFFAKAGCKSTNKPVASGNVLQRLMSNPAHSVEHIEKQQRSITPQEIRQKNPSCSDKQGIPIPGKSDKHVQSESNLCSSLGLVQSHSPLATRLHSQSLCEDTTELSTSPFSQFLENQKPLLMTPMMFTTPSSLKEVPLSNTNIEPAINDGVDLLTEKQLAQALIYLLRNNSDFTRQIHEAYVSSIMEKVKPSSSS